jgi:hypothetical protein
MGQYGNQPDFGTRAVAITPKGFAGGSYVNVPYQDGDNNTQVVNLTTVNLNVSTLFDGTPILKASSEAEWDLYTSSNNVPCWAYYDFDDNYAAFGKVYNWYAAGDPALYSGGYFLLDTTIVQEMVDGSKNPILGQQLKSIPTAASFDIDTSYTTLWGFSEDVEPGTNNFNFTGLPGGDYDGDSWKGVNDRGRFWSNDLGHVEWYGLDKNIDYVQYGNWNEKAGFYIRLEVVPKDKNYVAPEPLNSAALYVGTGGDLVVTIVGSKTPVMFKNVPDASFLPIIVSNVWERGDDGLTTASDIIAIY